MIKITNIIAEIGETIIEMIIEEMEDTEMNTVFDVV